MEFEVHRNDVSKNKEKFSETELDLAYKFSTMMNKEFGDLVKAIVLFGSITKDDGNKKKGDIDILVIIDDLTINLSAEIVETYRILTEKIISQVSTKLHVTSLRYITFWDYVRDANPIAVNILRDGLALIDKGFIAPLQHLLRQGRIKPSIESIWQYFSRSTGSLSNANGHVLQGALDLYWAVVDSSQALLMRYNFVSPSPEHVADLIKKELVPKNILSDEHVETMKEFYTLSRIILHDELKTMSGKDFDGYYKKAHKYVSDVKKELEKLDHK